jgi:hypothetical protein
LNKQRRGTGNESNEDKAEERDEQDHWEREGSSVGSEEGLGRDGRHFGLKY